MKPTLIYVYDPLCGWCFSFHPVMEKLAKRFEEELNIKVIPGGLAVDDNVREIGEDYEYFMAASKRAEEISGISFGKNFKLLAEEGSYLYNSEPPCRAQNVVNELCPDCALEFAIALQKAFFIDGENLNDWSTFKELMTDFPIDTDLAETLYSSDKIKQKTIEHFEWVKKQDASAFPTLLLKIGDEIGLMSRGYRPFDTLESHLHHLLRNIQRLES